MSKWRNMLKATIRGIPPEQERFEKQHPHLARLTREELNKLEYTPKALPHGGSSKQTAFVKAELQKMREERAVSMIRAKVSELNDAIAKAVEFGIKVEIDTLDHYRSDRPGCPATHLTATISKTL